MARIVGAITTSHIPAIGSAIARGLQDEPYWKPFFGAFPRVHEWLQKARPDAVVVVYNDHGLQFFLDKMPTFAVGAAMPVLTVLVTPRAALIPVVVVTSIFFLALLGGLGAHAGGDPLLKAALRVTFWGALAMALTAGVGALFGATV